MSNLKQFRDYAHSLMNSHQYENAIFYAELVINSNEDCASDFLLFAEALYHNKQFRRVIDFIEQRGLEKKYLTFRLLAAQCCVAIKEFIKALQFLSYTALNSNLTKISLNMTVSSFCEMNNGFWTYDNQEAIYFGRSYKELESNCCLLLGEIYEHMENRESATDFYKQAAKADVRNFNAIRKLYKGNMMKSNEARCFLSGLDYNECGDETWATFLRTTYENMFHLVIIITGAENADVDLDKDVSLTKNDTECISDVHIVQHPYLKRLNEATNLYNDSRFKKCYELTKSILKDEPHNTDCFILHSAVLKELKMENELFRFASNLVDMYPEKKESWYAMGCYYLATGRSLLSRKQFLKATEIDKFFGYSWLAVGHTYSIENERDQALAAYCSASHAISESHIPILYIAVEYSLSKTMSVSLNYLEEAMNLGSSDPYCWHEKGFILYNNKNYQEALKCFLHAYDIRKDDSYTVITFWEPLLNNIGQCFYKLGEFDKSLTFLEKALGKKPKNPATLSSMALVYARKSDFSAAKTYLNKVLGLNRDNLFALSLLQVVSNLNYKYPRKQFEIVNFDEVFKRPQSAFRGPLSSAKDTFFDKCSASDSLDSFRRVGNSENVNVDSDEEMDFT